MDFNLDRLRTFIVVARTGNLSAAARELGATQPNVGRQMAALEKEVRLTLFIRHSRGLSLTKQGEEFRIACQDIVGQIVQIADIIREKDSKPEGILKIVTGLGTTETILNNLHIFIEQFPKIDFRFLSTTDIYQFQIGDADVGLIPIKFSEPNIVQHHLFNMTLRIYAAPSYFKKHSMPKTLEDLKSHQMIVYARNDQEVLQLLNLQIKKDHTSHIYSQSFIEVNNGINMRSALINGFGIGTYFYDQNIVNNNLLIDVFPEMPDHKVPYYYTYHRRLEGSPKIQAFHEFLKKVVKVWERPDKS